MPDELEEGLCIEIQKIEEKARTEGEGVLEVLSGGENEQAAKKNS